MKTLKMSLALVAFTLSLIVLINCGGKDGEPNEGVNHQVEELALSQVKFERGDGVDFVEFVHSQLASYPSLKRLTLSINGTGSTEYNQILNFSNNIFLEEIYIISNIGTADSGGYYSLNLSGLSGLVILQILGTPVRSLNLADSINLEFLSLNEIGIESLGMPNSTSLKSVRLVLDESELAGFSTKNLPDLERLTLISTFSDLDLSSNSKLTYLNVASPLNSLDLTSNLLLEEVIVSGADLRYLDLTNQTNLKAIDISLNQLEQLDLGANPDLYRIDVSSNPLRIFNYGELPSLSAIDTSRTELDCDVVLDLHSPAATQLGDVEKLNCE